MYHFYGKRGCVDHQCLSHGLLLGPVRKAPYKE